MAKEVKWRDRRKNIYTLTVIHCGHGYIAHIETHSNKKKAEARLARLIEMYVEELGSKPNRDYVVQLHSTKLQRKTQWD